MSTDQRVVRSVAVAMVIAGSLAAHRACHAKRPVSNPSPIVRTSPDGVVAKPAAPAGALAQESSEKPAPPAKLPWKGTPPEIAGLPSGLIPVDGKRRRDYQTLVNTLGDHARWWGADVEDTRRRQRMILGVRAVDQALLGAWDGTVKADRPHAKGEVSDRAGLAAFLMETCEKSPPDLALKIAGVEEKYAFDDPALAMRGRALALLGSFPDDPHVVDFLRRRMAEPGPPDIRGLAAANLVRLGQEAGTLDAVVDSESKAYFLSVLSEGTWEGVKIRESDALGGFAAIRPEEMSPALVAGIVGILNDRRDRPAFLAAVKVLRNAEPDSPGYRAVDPLWSEARRDPELAVLLMDSRYNWRGSGHATHVLHELALSEDARLSLLATSQLWPLTDDASIATLLRLLRHDDPRRVRAAALSLRGAGGVRPEPVLAALREVVSRNADSVAVEQAREAIRSIEKSLTEARR